MTTFLKRMQDTLFGTDSGVHKVSSFNDFSLNTGSDAESELDGTSSQEGQHGSAVKENLRPRRTNVWQETFAPHSNANMKRLSGSFYDAPAKNGQPKTVWEQILKADFVKHAAFNEFDVDKNGYIDASDLRKRLGADANVEALIKQADRNGDGKIDQSEFCELLKEM